jgi:zinc transport system substrate-binding protein
LKKIVTLVFIIAIALTSLLGCSTNQKERSTISTGDSDKIKVVVSFNPLREFAMAVGKDKIEVVTMVPEGVEPHDFEPKAKDLMQLSEAKIFVYNGLGMESWVDKSLSSIDNKKLNVVDASKGSNLIKNISEDEIKEHGQYDPHIWLSLKEAQGETKNIKDALIKVDEKNKDYYEKNYEEFINSLDKLYTDYKGKFENLQNKSFVTGHAAFGYLCRDFGLNQQSVEGVFAEGEPTAAKLKELVDYSKKNNVKTIFVEELASPKVSETLATEVNAKVQKIYTIECREDNKTYLDAMKENLENIYSSLK